MPDNLFQRPDDPHAADPVTAALLEAFDTRVRTSPVDEHALIAGTRSRLRLRRRTRRVTTAAASLVAAAAVVPLAVSLWPTPSTTTTLVQSDSGTSTAATPVPSISGGLTTPTTDGQIEVPDVVGLTVSDAVEALTAAGWMATVARDSVPSQSVAVGLIAVQSAHAADPDTTRNIRITRSSGPDTNSSGGVNFSQLAVAYEIPDLPNAHPMQPGGQTVEGTSGRLESPLAGPVGCAVDSPDPLSIAGRQMQWVEDTDSQDVTTLIVTGWPTGTAAATFDAATSGSLACRVTGQLTPLDVTIEGADQSWAVTADLGPSAEIAGAARVGDLIVGASLRASTPQEATARSGELSALLTAAVQDLRSSGLPATLGR